MSRLNLVLLSLLFHALTNAQSPEFFESSTKDFRLFLPKDWNGQNGLTGNLLFSYTPPSNKKEALMPTTLNLEKGTLKEGFQNADIKEIAKQESIITKAGLGNNIIVSTDSLRFINNKLWWCFAFTTKGAKKSRSSFYLLKTVHNQATYSLTFSGPEESFDLNYNAAIQSMLSFMFYSQDKTVYSNSATLDKSKIASTLRLYEGQYKQESQDYSHTLFIENSGTANSYGKEVREFIKNGKKIRFEANLVVEEINDKQIILSTDAVSKDDPSIQWTKALFTLTKTPEGLSGTMGSKNNAFEAYEVNLVKAQGTQPNNKNQNNSTKTNTEIAKDNKVADAIVETETEEMDEVATIEKFGDSHVVRAPNGGLSLMTSDGRDVILMDKGTDQDEDQIRYKFLRIDWDISSYVVSQRGLESDNIVLVHMPTGNITIIPSVNYKMSANKKWICVFNTDLINASEESTIKVFSLSPKGIKESFSVTTFNTATLKGWGAGSISWMDNYTIEVTKVTANQATEELKPAGKTWVTMQNGKWSVVNTKPPKKADKTEEIASAEELPIYDGTQASLGKATVVPSASERMMVGGTTPDELGRVLVTALKNNDIKVWYGCILNATMSKAQESLEFFRKQLVMDGLTNWSLLKFKRVTYSEVSHNGKVKAGEYRYFHVEFAYGTEYLGRMECNLIQLHKGKYVVVDPFYTGGIKRKEDYH